jgi:DNA-directed RNA polymerase subunit RPC12/RpoP
MIIEKVNRLIRNTLVGRYGTDALSKLLLVCSLVVFLLFIFIRNPFLYLGALALLIFAYYRILSRDFAARKAENEHYLKGSEIMRAQVKMARQKFSERKIYRYFKCPGCGQEVRVPKGKGRIRITCPKCHIRFDRTV